MFEGKWKQQYCWRPGFQSAAG